jgi:hypothetical protein
VLNHPDSYSQPLSHYKNLFTKTCHHSSKTSVITVIGFILALAACDESGGAGRAPLAQADLARSNSAPVIPQLRNLSVREGSDTGIPINATDADGDDILYFLTGIDAEDFRIADNGMLAFLVTPNFTNPVDANNDNIYEIQIIASDGTAISSASINIRVESQLTFATSAQYANRCGEPRTGIDPGTGSPFTDLQGSFADENNFLRSWSNNTYLWYDEIVDVDPAANASSARDVANYFELMKTFGRSPSGNFKDRFHFTYNTEEWQLRSTSGQTVGYGANFILQRRSPPRSIVVSFVEPHGSASSAAVNLRRGTQIISVDGVDVENGADIDSLNAGIFPSAAGETHEFEVRDFGASKTRTISMTAGQIIIDPAPTHKVITTPTGAVGYLQFNSHIATAEAALIEAVADLDNENITDLVLDLRYNQGGYLIIANQLAFMIGGAKTRGQTFSALQFNDKYPSINPITREALQPRLFQEVTVGLSSATGSPLPSLELDRVFVLTGNATCSASEALMNGLRGVDIQVIQIGATTCGKPYGYYPQPNCGTTYFSTQFRGVNAKGFGDYPDGFSPENLAAVKGVALTGCAVEDDFSEPFGSENEAVFAAALAYRASPGACPALPINSNFKQSQTDTKRLPGNNLEIHDNRALIGTILR